MRSNRFRCTWWTPAAAAVLCTAALASDGPVPLALSQLPDLARSGRFDQVLDSLRGHEPNNHDDRVAALIRDLEHHQRVKAERTAERREAYAQAIAEVQEHLNEAKLHEALRKALEADDLALDDIEVRQEPLIQTLVDQTEDAARQAERAGDWVEATGLHRALDLLFDDPSSRHHANLKRALKHVRVLRLYSPKVLHDLAVARAKREGEEDQIEPYQTGDSTWEERLRGVKRKMLESILEHAVKKHVDSPTYETLLLGALDSLLVLVNTHDLAETFESFKDERKIGQFRDYLVDLRMRVEQRHKPMTFRDAFTEVVHRVINENNKTVALPPEVITYEMGEGAMGELDDFTSVIWPYDKDTFTRSTKGNFFGVGIQISLRDKRLIVVSPLPDTPAYRAGIQAGDIITKVDGRPTEGWTLDKAVRKITGDEGTIVTLGIERKGQHPVVDFPIRRSRIEIESVRGWRLEGGGGGDWDFWIDRENRIAYVRLSQFIPKTADGVDEAIENLEREGPLNGLILDLRFNPGGLLKSAIEVCDRFVDRGPIVSTVGANGVATSPAYRARQHHTYRRFPLVVLVNQHSASASEIVAGAIQDYRLGTIVGVRSFGKGSVQDLFSLDRRKAYLKLTSQYYKLPLSRIIHRSSGAKNWGIDPDVLVAMTDKQIKDAVEHRREADVIRDPNMPAEDDAEPAAEAEALLTNSLDPQLEAALLILKTRLIADHLKLARHDEPVAVP